MVSIGKINIGRKEKRSFFPLNHDVNTTSDFGFCQPTLVRHFGKNSKISLRSNAFVRLAPLPVPTFGRIEAKMHTAFVPMKEVFEAFDFQQANKAVSSALRSYVPTQTDFCQSGWLLGQLWTLFFSSAFYIGPGTSSPSKAVCNQFLDMIPFRVSLWVRVENFSDILLHYGDSTSSFFGTDKWIDIWNDERIWNDTGNSSETKELTDIRHACYEIFCNYLSPSDDNVNIGHSIRSYLYNYFGYSVNNVQINTGQLDDLNPYDAHPLLFTSLGIKHDLGTWEVNNTNYSNEDFYFDSRNLRNCDSRKQYLYDKLGKYNIDYMFHDQSVSATLQYDQYIDGDVEEKYLYQGIRIGVHLSPNGKRVQKILNACGVTFGYSDNPVSLPKLFAYYKTWFDKYNAGRDVQWRDTYCYKLIHSYYDTGVVTQQLLNTAEPVSETFEFLNDDIVHNIRYNWLHFLIELPTCTYCLKLDNITVAVDSPILEVTQPQQGNMSDIPTLSLAQGAGQSVEFPVNKDYTGQANTDDSVPYYDVDARFNGLSVAVAQVLYKLVNKNSVLGSKVDEYLRAHGIANGLPKTKVLDDQSFMCSLDEVFATVNNDQSALGEYAGKGVGSGHSGSMYFETEEDGFLIQLFTMVPLGGYVQASQPEFINRYDFYNSEFDSLGMEPLRMSSVIGRQYFFDTPKQDKTFGFVPRYFQHKIQNNLSNGGFALLSEQASFLPYSLDRIFSTGTIDQVFDSNQLTGILNEPQAVEELRYIGRDEQFGNYDRIFYDMTGRTDNFIVHIIQDFSMYAPMRPISHSFDTFDENNDDSSVELNHA